MIYFIDKDGRPLKMWMVRAGMRIVGTDYHADTHSLTVRVEQEVDLLAQHVLSLDTDSTKRARDASTSEPMAPRR